MDGEQGVSSLLESVKAHIDERLRSPFGGAFLISWIIVNWERIFLFIFSSITAEEKVAIIKNAPPSTHDLLWAPLGYAAIGLVSYYFLSSVAIALFETYGVVRRFIEQKFDSYRWVPPSKYIEWKKESIATIKDFQEVASDKFDKITDLEAKLLSMQAEVHGLKSEAKQLSFSEEKLKVELSIKSEEILKMGLQLSVLEKQVFSAQSEFLNRLNEVKERIESEAKNFRVYMRRLSELNQQDPEDVMFEIQQIDKMIEKMMYPLRGLISNLSITRKVDS